MFTYRVVTLQRSLFMKKKYWVLGLFVSLILIGCMESSGNGTVNLLPAGKGISIKINCELKNVARDTLRVYDLFAGTANVISYLPVSGNGAIRMDARVPTIGIYAIGFSAQNSRPLVLGDKEITLIGDASDMKNSTIQNASLNQNYEDFVKQLSSFQSQYAPLNQKLSELSANQTTVNPEINVISKTIDSIKKAEAGYLEVKLKEKNFISTLASIYYFPPYLSKPEHSIYSNELEYVKKQFIAQINYADSTLGYLPVFGEKIAYFCSFLVQQGTSADDALKVFLDHGSRIPAGTKARALFYFSLLAASERASQELFALAGEKYVQEFPTGFKASEVKQVITPLLRIRVGSVVPELELNDPSGKALKLSHLRGKVVLLDFWASWCGPCRKENPNVVKLYNQYKSKGFEILGVSLDTDKEKWKNAIEQDGLTWKHISDLGGWRSSAASLYGVSSIPATFLLDKEGKLIAKGLRGQALENKLAELLK